MKSQANLSAVAMKNNCENVAAILKAISHPQRLMLLCHLAGGEKTVGHLEKALRWVSVVDLSVFETNET